MGFIRGGLLVIAGVVLFISLLLGNLFLTLTWSLERENVQQEANSVLGGVLKEQGGVEALVGERIEFMQSYCQNNTEFVYSQGEFALTVPCETVSQGSDAVIDYSLREVMNKYYDMDYTCGFWDCFKQSETPFFLISAKAHDFWYSKFFLTLVVSLILAILIFILVEQKSNFGFVTGSLLILSALPFIKLESFVSLFSEKLSVYGDFLSILFSQSSVVFWRVLFVGIIFLVLGIILKFFKIGFKISEIFSKKETVSKDEVKEIVKKEVKKAKEQTPKKKESDIMKALILVDFEKEWMNKNSEYFVGDISNVINNVNRLIEFCRKNKYKIIFTKHIENNSEEEFAENSDNVEIIDQLNKNNSDVIITKYKISPFYQTNLERELRDVKEIVVCGILTNLCVRSLVQDAYDRDFEIVVIKDCCVAFDKKTQEFTFKDLKETREEVEFTNLENFLKK